ncbi:MAG: hypothetical protein WKF77_00910 [Planctomycetaceae bacterium]
MNFGGSFSLSGLGTYVRQSGTAGTVNLTGTLTIPAGSTLVLDRSSTNYGTWTLSGGTVSGGSVATGNGAQLQMSTGTLNGTSFATGADVITTANAVVSVSGGLTVDGILTLGTSNGYVQGLFFNGTQILAGTGEIVSNGNQGLWLNLFSATLRRVEIRLCANCQSRQISRDESDDMVRKPNRC